MIRKSTKEYKEGSRAWGKNKRLSDNPYTHGTKEWQSWLNGWSDRSDQGLLAIMRKGIQL